MKNRVRGLIEAGLQGLFPPGQPLPTFDLERPRVPAHGELATNAPLVAAKQLGERPPEVARKLAASLKHSDLFSRLEVAGPGFLNLTLKPEVWQESLREIVQQGEKWGQSDWGKGRRVVLEFLSANPTGPIHIGNARGGPLGDALASLLEASGFEVTREYYLNDTGGQISQLGKSILHWLDPDRFPERGYLGDYVKELAARLSPEIEKEGRGSDDLVEKVGRQGVDLLLQEIREDCEEMGIRFDSWVRETDILTSKTKHIIELLKEKSCAVEKEGALWFSFPTNSSEPSGLASGERIDRESVLVKSDGRPTYFANDIAYHVAKYGRGFHRMIDIWGSNHHGHVPRVKAALKAVGCDPDQLEVVLYQYVRVKRGPDAVKMSKRGGEFITAREVLEEVGCDAFRFFLLMRAPESHLDFDLELAKRHTQENPVYYVQYAHARLSSLFRKAIEQKTPLDEQDVPLGRLILPEELELIRMIHEFPEEVRRAAERLEAHRIPFYLLELSKVFQAYYTRAKADSRYRILGSDIDTTRAKLYLAKILQRTIANGLKLIGVSAPEVMASE